MLPRILWGLLVTLAFIVSASTPGPLGFVLAFATGYFGMQYFIKIFIDKEYD